MTGLDKIVSKIAQESAALCAGILEDANKTASEIIATARKESAEKGALITDKAKKEADRITAVAKSSAETVTRNKYLEVRNAVINDIISAAYEEIEKMNDNDYFELLYKLCVKYVETGECMLYLSQRDLERLPKNFEDRVNGTVYERAAVQVSKTAKDIEDGFILDYGDFEVNCTIKAVFDENMDKFKDLLCSKLFL